MLIGITCDCEQHDSEGITPDRSHPGQKVRWTLPWYISPTKILKEVGPVASKLGPTSTLFCYTFYFFVSMLCQYIPNELHVLQHDFVELMDYVILLRKVFMVDILEVLSKSFVDIVSDWLCSLDWLLCCVARIWWIISTGGYSLSSYQGLILNNYRMGLE